MPLPGHVNATAAAATTPSLDQMRRLAGDGGTTVPVWRELLADLETPVSAYRKLAATASHAFLLESVEGGEHAAHHSFVGADPRAVVEVHRDHTLVRDADGSERRLPGGDPLEVLRRECSRDVRVTPGAPLPRFAGGAVGYLGYECAARWERVPMHEHGGDVPDVPDAVLLLCDTLLAFDHIRHRVLAITNIHVPAGGGEAADGFDLAAAYERAGEQLDAVVARLASPLAAAVARDVAVLPAVSVQGDPHADARCNREPDDYRHAVERAREYIAAGEVIQVVVSQRWTRPLRTDPFDVYRALRVTNPSPYVSFLQLGDDLALAGASPELLVQVRGRQVATHPIAGTSPRGATPEEDLELEAALRSDPKERAEHVMLVDLGRNDVGRVCEPGSVRVSGLMDVERYSQVMHLTSHVTGTLRDGLTPLDALRSCFPAGTLSGAPKLRAMELLQELEPDRRGPYAGALGWVGNDGSLDMAITIRTIVMSGGEASVQAGAGIVADSDPEREYQETRSKSRAMLTAVELAERLQRPAAGSPGGGD